MADEKIPAMECPMCGIEAIPATGRGRNTDDEFVEHREGCRCAHCTWVWADSHEVTCHGWQPVRAKESEALAWASQVLEVE
jgi:hypothetical protein